MKKQIILIGIIAFTISCGRGITWEDYEATCVKTNLILKSEEAAKKQCACETELYKTAGMLPTDMSNNKKVNKVDISSCNEN